MSGLKLVLESPYRGNNLSNQKEKKRDLRAKSRNMYTPRLMEESMTEILRTVEREAGKSRVTEAWEGSFKKRVTLCPYPQ